MTTPYLQVLLADRQPARGDDRAAPRSPGPLTLAAANPWSLQKGRALRRLLIDLAGRAGDIVAIDPADGSDPDMILLRHTDIAGLRACVYRHGQAAGTFGIFFEYPFPVPGILESEENLTPARALASLALHFDA